jgi:hypothetical protein
VSAPRIQEKALLPPVKAIARVVHEANRAYCITIGDDSQLPWDEAPEWQRSASIEGVEFLVANPLAHPIDAHARWMQGKLEEGWTYGPDKDPEAKLHPCLVPYALLPELQRRKDYLFVSVVRALLREP